MASVLVPALCLLSGAYAQEWGVTFTPGPLSGRVGSCITIPCSFTYPAGHMVTTVSWTLDGNKTVYHSDKSRIHTLFKGRAHYLGDLQNNCSLRLSWLCLSDQGTYHFRFGSVIESRNSEAGQRLLVSDPQCQPSLGSQMEPGPSLVCSVGTTCPLQPSWYNTDGAQRSPGQTLAGAKATELPISPSRLPPSVVRRCQVDGYWDGCNSDLSLPPGAVASEVPSIKVLRPTGKVAIKEGDGFTLRCRADALGHIAGYIWSRGDVWLPGAGPDFSTDKANVSDGGSYSCGVWVSGPGWAYLSLSARESVKVQHAPKDVSITATPRADLCEGDTVKLTCHFSSSVPAAVTYTWYKDNASLGVSQPDLVLQGLTATHTGEYRCEVQNQVGTARSPPIAITVPGCSRCQYLSPGLVAGILGASLVLVILVNIGACYLRRTQWRQVGANQAADGAELSHRPEAESPYQELQKQTQNIYSQLDCP